MGGTWVKNSVILCHNCDSQSCYLRKWFTRSSFGPFPHYRLIANLKREAPKMGTQYLLKFINCGTKTKNREAHEHKNIVDGSFKKK